MSTPLASTVVGWCGLGAGVGVTVGGDTVVRRVHY
jgi:hypothetical protein